MGKLKIKKQAKNDVFDSFERLEPKPEYSLFQLDVPGVGRLRTGERHSNFHITDIENEAFKNKLTKEKI